MIVFIIPAESVLTLKHGILPAGCASPCWRPGRLGATRCLTSEDPTLIATVFSAAACPSIQPTAPALFSRPLPAGGLVYVSDRVGEHDFSLLRRLVLPDGSVLRCRLPGRPTADCLFADVSRDGATALKVRRGGWPVPLSPAGSVAATAAQGCTSCESC